VAQATSFTWEKVLTAELAVLASELNEGKQGVWLNSRSCTSGVTDLVRCGPLFMACRVSLPPFVTSTLENLYSMANVSKGCPDLIIWHTQAQRIRFVEVKCPHWDRVSAEQDCFITASSAVGVSTKIVEWEFIEDVS